MTTKVEIIPNPAYPGTDAGTVIGSFTLDKSPMDTLPAQCQVVGADGPYQASDFSTFMDVLRKAVGNHGATTWRVVGEPVHGGDVVAKEDLTDDELTDIEKAVEDYEFIGEIAKMDEEKQQVFGWAYVTHDKDGKLVIDKSGEFVDAPDELEKTAYSFVLKSRAGDLDHTNLQSATMIESMVFTPEKIAKMGIPPGVLPTAWWIGFHVPEKDDWEQVKKRKAFSVHGRGVKKAVE